MVSEYLETLKSRGNWSFPDLSAATGLSESTIRRIFSDPDNNPTLDTLVKLVATMGGSLDKLAGLESCNADAKRNDSSKLSMDDMHDLRVEMLTHQRESYERELSSLRMENDRLRGEKKLIRRTLYATVAIMITLMFITIMFLIYDITHLDRGWIQAYYGVESGRHGISSILMMIVKEIFG